MKASKLYKVLALAGLFFYTGFLFAEGGVAFGAAGAPAAPSFQIGSGQKQSEIKAADRHDRNMTCTTALQAELAGTNVIIPDAVEGKNIDFKSPGFKDAATNHSASYRKFTNCLNGITTTADPDANPKCERIEKEIDDAAEKLAADCKNAPKVAANDSGDNVTIDTAESAKLNVSTWGVCLQDAKSCDPAGDNDSAEACSEMTLEDIAKGGGNNAEKLKSFCQDRYPPQCGPLEKTGLRETAKDLDRNLTTDLSDMQKDIALKKRDIQEAQDKLMEADKTLQGLPAKFDRENKALLKQYEAMMEASNQALDASLLKNYETISADEKAIRIAADAVRIADATKFDAQNKYILSCKARAKAMADQQFPTGSVKYGGQNALVTRNARWSDYYAKQLQEMYSDGTTCDGGNFANTQLALLNAQKAALDSESQLAQDQNQLRLAIQQVARKKSDANYKGLMDQADRVRQLAEQQKQENTTAITEKQKLGQKGQDARQELMKLEAQVVAGAKKKQCIQTIRSCASVSGIPNGSNKDVPDLTNAPRTLGRLLASCKEAAKVCNDDRLKSPNEQIASSKLAFTKYLEGLELKNLKSTDIPVENLPYDTAGRASVCADAIATNLEYKKGPLRKTKKTSK